MDASGVTNWTATNATRTKSTTTGVTLGSQALRVQNSSGNGYVQSATVAVEPSQTYLVAADATISSGTAVLELWDVTNGASIKTATSAELQSRRVWMSANIPSTCRQVAVRLKGTEVTADIYWDNCSLLNLDASEMGLPSWFANKKWLEWVKFWRPGTGSAANDDKALDDIRRHPSIGASIIEDKQGYTPYKLKFDKVLSADALLVGQALSPYTELSADADTTNADPDMVKACVLYDIYADKGDNPQAEKWLARLIALDGHHQAKWTGKRYTLQR